MKKIIIAPDSFKGSLNSIEICEIVKDAALSVFPDLEVVEMPIADGGEGFVDAMLYPGRGKKYALAVKDPLWRDIQASYGILNDGTAVIEMAAASGLPLLKDHEKNVLDATTYGTGQLILDALARGCRHFILGVGGSATNDGGAGAAAALGIRYLDASRQVITCGKDLVGLMEIDPSEIVEGLHESTFTIACDVNNPLHGPNGAARIYGPQKGASPSDLELLDEGLRVLADVILRSRRIDLQQIPGTGAAGGITAPFISYVNANLRSGVDIVLDAGGFDQNLYNCDLVITGEGCTDRQSSMGKALSGIARRSKKNGVPVLAISGSLKPGYEALYEEGISAVFSTCREVSSLEDALINARPNLLRTAKDVFRLIEAGIR
jgi:glycerate kinase